jgi:hypothetical protein
VAAIATLAEDATNAVASSGYDPRGGTNRQHAIDCFFPSMCGYTRRFAGGLYALAGFALMSAVISARWLRIPNPVRQELASVPAE